jgi:hypothetical protein
MRILFMIDGHRFRADGDFADAGRIVRQLGAAIEAHGLAAAFAAMSRAVGRLKAGRRSHRQPPAKG